MARGCHLQTHLEESESWQERDSRGPREAGRLCRSSAGAAALGPSCRDGDKEHSRSSVPSAQRWVSLLPSDLTSQNPQETRGSTAATGPFRSALQAESGNGGG